MVDVLISWYKSHDVSEEPLLVVHTWASVRVRNALKITPTVYYGNILWDLYEDQKYLPVIFFSRSLYDPKKAQMIAN